MGACIIQDDYISVASAVVRKLLANKINDPKYFDDPVKDPYEITPCVAIRSGVARDTIYKLLKTVGVFSSAVKYDRNEGCSWMKRDYRWTAHVNKDWLDKNLSKFAKQPEFKIKDKVESYNNGFKDVRAATEEDQYVSLSSIHGAEILWVYLHLHEFDIKKVDTTHKVYRNSRSSSASWICDHTSVSHNLVIFPKNMLASSSVAIYLQRVQAFLDRDMEWCARNILKMKDENNIALLAQEFKELDREVSYNFSDSSNRTKMFMDSQILCTYKLVPLLSKLSIALAKLKEAVDKRGGWDALKKETYETFLTHMKNNFPLYINDKNEALRELAMMVTDGRSQGINPRIQELEKALCTK
jgi:hypothetical protein